MQRKPATLRSDDHRLPLAAFGGSRLLQHADVTPPVADAACGWDDPAELARFTRWVARDGAAPVAESCFALEGIDCAVCSLDIEHALLALAGVHSADVNPVTGRAVVRWDPVHTRASTLARAIEEAGYRAYPALSIEAEAGRMRQRRVMLWRLFVAGFCMMQVMMYAFPAYVADPGTLGDDVAGLLQWASWLLTIPVVLFSARPFLDGACNDIRRRRVGMDVPVALGILVTFVASTGAAFDPGGFFGSETYFDSLTMFVFFLLGGRYLEMRARERSAAALEGLARRMPATTERVRDDGSSEVVPVGDVHPGDRLRVRPGQSFPADGRLVDGDTRVDEAMLTGESCAVRRRSGDDVVAGSFNVWSPVDMLVERTAGDTRWAQIISADATRVGRTAA
jgi:P-type Cu2+ transporter